MISAPKLVGVIALLTLMAYRPVWSAPAMQRGRADPVDARRSTGRTAFLAPRPSSVFLPKDEGRLLALTNRERRARGLPPLFLSIHLRDAARAHARDMALQGYVGHTSRYGLGVRDRMAQYLRPGSRIGENLAFVQTIEQGHLAFVESWHHRRNILDPAFRRIGIGVATMGNAGIMIDEEFVDVARPLPQPSPHHASAIHNDSTMSRASTAPLTASRSVR